MSDEKEVVAVVAYGFLISRENLELFAGTADHAQQINWLYSKGFNPLWNDTDVIVTDESHTRFVYEALVLDTRTILDLIGDRQALINKFQSAGMFCSPRFIVDTTDFEECLDEAINPP